jgi:hypothetical protein
MGRAFGPEGDGKGKANLRAKALFLAGSMRPDAEAPGYLFLVVVG